MKLISVSKPHVSVPSLFVLILRSATVESVGFARSFLAMPPNASPDLTAVVAEDLRRATATHAR